MPQEEAAPPVPRAVPPDVASAIDEALNSPFMVVATNGPAMFTVKSEGRRATYKVSVGLRNTCTCPRNGYCGHIMFILLKVFHVDVDSATIQQKGFSCIEVDRLLSHTMPGQPGCRRPAAPVVSTRQRTLAKRMNQDGRCHQQQADIRRKSVAEEDECPVCFDTLRGAKALLWCKRGCGNSIHATCLMQWAAHNRSAVGRTSCPLCRTAWDPADFQKKPAPEPSKKEQPRPCKHCGRLIEGCSLSFSCSQCRGFDFCWHCAVDPLVHPAHQYIVHGLPGGSQCMPKAFVPSLVTADGQVNHAGLTRGHSAARPPPSIARGPSIRRGSTARSDRLSTSTSFAVTGHTVGITTSTLPPLSHAS
ncbi:putative E3 ubiquitin-protein ligase Zswim2-like [Diplonema papillatum]|nr:putative E3 ubiquitin-protein ligase Zswim2-like [Diplonema papillatum]